MCIWNKSHFWWRCCRKIARRMTKNIRFEQSLRHHCIMLTRKIPRFVSSTGRESPVHLASKYSAEIMTSFCSIFQFLSSWIYGKWHAIFAISLSCDTASLSGGNEESQSASAPFGNRMISGVAAISNVMLLCVITLLEIILFISAKIGTSKTGIINVPVVCECEGPHAKSRVKHMCSGCDLTLTVHRIFMVMMISRCLLNLKSQQVITCLVKYEM